MINKASIITIDPGLAGTGVALWNNKTYFLMAQNFYCSNKKEKDFKVRGELISKDLCSYVKRSSLKTTKVYIEYPLFFKSSHGEMVASSGKLVKLAWFVGLLHGELLHTLRDTSIELLPVNKWKGQLPKEIVIKRIERVFTKRQLINISSHSYDAIGMGLHLRGDL